MRLIESIISILDGAALKKVCEMVKKSNNTYDLVIVTRFDMCLLTKFNLSEIDANNFYSGDWITYYNGDLELFF